MRRESVRDGGWAAQAYGLLISYILADREDSTDAIRKGVK